MNTQKLQLYFFFTILVLVLVLAGRVFLPFIVPLAIAASLAVVLNPVKKYFLSKMPTRNGLAVSLSMLVLAIAIVAPVLFLGNTLFQETGEFVRDFSIGNNPGLSMLGDTLEVPIKKLVPTFELDVERIVKFVATWIQTNLGTIFSETANIAANVVLGIIILFYFLKDGHVFKEQLIKLSPLKDSYDRGIAKRLEVAVTSVMRGTVLVALVQGIVAGLGLWIAGVPHAVLWASLAAVASLIPGLGTALVLVPAIIYLAAVSGIGWAVFLAVWAIFAVGLIDNTLFPVLVGSGFKVHPLFILLSVLGGIIYFGPVGFVLGPVIVSLLFALLDIYREIIVADEGNMFTKI